MHNDGLHDLLLIGVEGKITFETRYTTAISVGLDIIVNVDMEVTTCEHQR